MSTSTPTLTSRNLLLRPLALSDVTPEYVAWLNDPQVNRHLETRHHPQSLETVAAYVERVLEDDSSHMWAMVDLQHGRHVGNIKLGPVSVTHARGEISFFVGDRDSWGRGLASEAVETVAAFGLNGLGLHKITGGCYHVNLGSIRVFEKAGFCLEAVLKEQYLCDGRFVDRCCFARFAETGEATR